ncbi:Uncharacterised protein [Mycobacteroides abscessus subsp. abscessus]|nr:Uncharacterised protein [Mycobacteroides abscessus subsp. abscessus]
MASATSTGRMPSNWSISWATPWPGRLSVDGVKPWMWLQSVTCTPVRRPSRRGLRTATRVTTQSRVRVCSRPRSTTVRSTP